jgi:hypothetical protein
MRYMRIGTCAALMWVTTCAVAQTPAERPRPTPEETQKIMDSALGAMGPVMGRMAEAMIEAQLKIAEKPETADSIATFKKNLYDALVKKGFKPGDALQIVLATGLPSASPMSR